MSSLGGNMNYIYGNTLVLGDSFYLAHHGILGQKWGIRRFQNKDGSRTAEGKKRYRSRRTVFEDYQNAQLDNVISNNKYNYKRHPIKYNPIKRSVLKKKADDLRSEYDDVLKNGRTNSGLFQKPRKGSISLTANEKKETLDAVRKADIEIRNPEYRFHDKVSVLAAATEKSTISACKKLAWYDAKRMDNEERRFVISEDLEDMYASFKKKNPGSQKEQFEKFNKIPEVKKLIDESDRLFDENEQLRKEQASECHRIAATVFDTTEWAKPFGEPRDGYNDTYLSVLERAIDVNSVMYASREAKKNIEHSLIGGNMNYIYGNTLILGDTSYLEHHGIKNQKWGIRRFQNPDGSLTAAGRIRYGVTGAAKAAFKVGKKLGAATASAARAGVKKAKDNAYEKKKEKASQTREGVLKNKKMFTNEELKRLEERFKIEDDMRNAGLRHGQEIAKTISAYSDAAEKTMNALQTGGKAVKAISDGLSALQDYKEKLDIGKKASDAGMSTADYKDYTKSRMEDKAKRDNERAQKKAEEAEKRAAEYKEKQAQAKAEAEAKAKADKEEAERQSVENSKDVARRQKQDIMDAIAAKRQAKADAEQAKKDQAAAERKEQRALKKEAKERDIYNEAEARKARYANQLEAGKGMELDPVQAMYKKVAKELTKMNYDTANRMDDRNIEAKRATKTGDRDIAIDYLSNKAKQSINPKSPKLVKDLATGLVEGASADAKKISSILPKGSDKGLASKIANKAIDEYKTNRSEKTKKDIDFDSKKIVEMLNGGRSESTIENFARSRFRNEGLRGESLEKAIDRYMEDLEKWRKLNHSAFLEHYGTKGQRWGIRRYQNPDGTRTALGKDRYGIKSNNSVGGGGSPEEDDETIADILGIDVDAYRQKINEGPFGYGQYADQLGEKAEKLHAQADANRKMADQVGLTGDKKKAAEFRKKADSLEKDAVKAEKLQTYMNRRANGESALGITADTVNTTIVKPITGLVNDIGRSVSASNPMNSDLARKIRRIKHGSMDSFMIENGVLSYGFDGSGELEHFGVRGMKWGVRRYQNPDGTLTEKGKKRYANPDGSLNAKGRKIDAKRLTKQLNANDKASAWAVRRREDSREQAERNETRAEKARSKGKLERAEKFDTLAKKQRDEQKTQNKKYLELEEKNGKLVAEAITKDYDVRQTPTMRDVTNGKEHVANIALELAATMAGLPFTYKTGMEVLGTDYRVKAKKASKNGQVVLSPAGMAVAAASKKKAKHDAFQIQNGVLMYGYDASDELEHFGIKNMKWGIRRFQNKDGSLTEAGKQRYANTGNLDSGGGGGGGAPEEEDEETKKAIEEAAKKAGMTVDEYRKKFADKVAEIKKKASETASAVGKSLNDIGSDKVAKSFSKQSYEFANKNAKKAEDYKRKAASAANAGDKDAAAYYNKQASRFETVAKQHGEQGKNWGDTYAETTITGRVKGAANAVKGASKKASEMASDAKYEVGYHAENALDAVTGQRSKRQAKAWTETARYHEKQAERAKAKYISGTRNPDSFEGRVRNSNNAVAARNQKRAKEAQEQANAWTNRYNRSLAGRAEATSKKIGAKAQEAKDKLKSKAPKRSIALEVANTGPAPITQTQIHTADLYIKYFGAVARARKTAANSTAAQRAKYGDRQNIRERAEAEELNNLRAREKRDEAIRLRMAKKFDKKADSARAHGNTAKAEAFEKESNRQFNKAPISGSKAEAFEAVRDAKLASHLVRNAATAKQAQSATLAENRNRNAAHLAERRREKAINDAKAKIRSGKLPTHELTRYAKSSVGQLKSAAKAELARRERDQALTSMGSDYARATARVTTTSSTTNTTDAHNEKLARDRRDKRKQAANASATAKKNRLAGSGRKKYTSSQTSSIGRVGSGRGKTSTRR